MIPDRVSVPYRSLLASLAFTGLVALATRFVPAEGALWDGLRLWAGTYLVALLPGLSMVLAWRPAGRITPVDALALGTAASLASVQILVIAAVGLHLPATSMLMVLAVATLLSLATVARRAGSATLTAWRPQFALLGLLLLPAAAAYVLGTPLTYASGEDGTHVAVVRRLAFLDAPAIDNLYWAPRIVYTYPFPATHYLIALVSRAADLDPLFVYRKIRFLWAFAAQLFLIAGAKCVFRSERVALLTGIGGVLFSLSGSFALVQSFAGESFSWSQLIPQSHAADVAMNVGLPALLVATFYLLDARGARDRTVLSAMTAALLLMLTIVHIREAVQFYVYLAAFVGGAAFLRRWDLAAKGLAIGGCGMAMTLTYLAWYQKTVGHIDTFVRERRDLLVQVASELRPADWIAKPFLHPAFGSSLDSFFFTWFPFLLLLGPALLLWRPRRPQAILSFFAILAYLLIVRFPFLTVPYIYLSYFEILFTPVRNVVFFAYVMTGLGAAIAAAGIARLRDPWRQGLATASLALVGAGAYRWGGAFLAQQPARWLELALFAHLFTLYLVKRHPDKARLLAARVRSGCHRSWMKPGIALLFLLAVLTFSPKASPLLVPMNSRLATVREAFQFPVIVHENVRFPYNPENPDKGGRHRTLRIATVVSVPPPQRLVDWATQHLSMDSVLAINLLNLYSPAPFMPQQIAYWPHIDDSTGAYFHRIFPAYYAHLGSSLAAKGEQPFFNASDSLEDRIKFLRDIGATHVLVDPMYHKTLVPVLASWPASFQLLYDSEGWAVYKAH